MPDADLLVPGDDDPAAMTKNERTAWAHLVTVIVTSGVYLALMVTRTAAGPVATIGWVGPMLWTIGSSVVGTIAGTIAGPITATIARSITSARLGPRGGRRRRSSRSTRSPTPVTGRST